METAIELSLLDRITLPTTLKKEGSFEEMIISKDITNKTKITQEDVKNYSIQTIEGKGLQWAVKEGESDSINITFTELEFNMVKEGLKKLQEEKKLTQDHIDLYRKFIK